MVHTLVYIFVGALIGLFIIQPVNDMVIYHLYEAETTAYSSWDFILQNLKKSISGQSIKKTSYYLVVGSVVGLLLALVASVIQKKLAKIKQLSEELGKDLKFLIAQGEGQKLEFKSSFRWDIKEKRANKALESVILKTIAGFMNGNGGSLLIGVTDDGTIIGLESDYSLLKRSDSDGFEQAIITIVATHLGTDLCQFTHIIFHHEDANEICRIIIKPSSRPVYLKQKGNPQFYLRTGGGTRDLNIQEATEYIKGRWN